MNDIDNYKADLEGFEKAVKPAITWLRKKYCNSPHVQIVIFADSATVTNDLMSSPYSMIKNAGRKK